MKGSSQRYCIVDTTRGIAILMMLVYHFFYDLDYFSLLHIDFYQDVFWLGFRGLIIALFLLLVGMSLVLADERGLSIRRFLHRLIPIALCATLISVVTYYWFGSRMIFFGILHFIAVASILGLLSVRLYKFNLVVGLSLITLGATVESTLFDHPWRQWLGMMSYKPLTEDYVPLLPWLGVVLIGMFVMRMLLNRDSVPLINASRTDVQLLSLAGRHGLMIYMLHQPVLFAILWLLTEL